MPIQRKEGDIMEFLKIFLLAVGVMIFVMAGFGIRILLEKGGKFPNLHIGSNRHMKERGVTCAQTFDKMEQSKARKELRFKELSLKDNLQSEQMGGTGYC